MLFFSDFYLSGNILFFSECFLLFFYSLLLPWELIAKTVI